MSLLTSVRVFQRRVSFSSSSHSFLFGSKQNCRPQPEEFIKKTTGGKSSFYFRSIHSLTHSLTHSYTLYLLAYFVDGVCPPFELQCCEMSLVAFPRYLIKLAVQGVKGERARSVLRLELRRTQVMRRILLLHYFHSMQTQIIKQENQYKVSYI